MADDFLIYMIFFYTSISSNSIILQMIPTTYTFLSIAILLITINFCLGNLKWKPIKISIKWHKKNKDLLILNLSSLYSSYLHMFLVILHDFSLQFTILWGHKLVQGEVTVIGIVFIHEVSTFSCKWNKSPCDFELRLCLTVSVLLWIYTCMHLRKICILYMWGTSQTCC